MDSLKEGAALAALRYVKSDMRLGLGTGSTVFFFLRALGQAIQAGLLSNIMGVPSSKHTEKICHEYGIPLTACDTRLDLYIDGADVIFPSGWVVKGGGGALLREKIVAQASNKHIIIAHDSKCSALTETFSLPVEILPFGSALTVATVSRILKSTSIPHRMEALSDNGNIIFHFPCLPQKSLSRLCRQLKAIVGVMEHGLFFLPEATFLIAHTNGEVSAL